mgnify:CR=1 FL=1
MVRPIILTLQTSSSSLKPQTPLATTSSQSTSTWISIWTSVCPTVMTKLLTKMLWVNQVPLSILLLQTTKEREEEGTLLALQTKNSSYTSKLYCREDSKMGVSDNQGRPRRVVGQTHGHPLALDTSHLNNYSSKSIIHRRRHRRRWVYPIMEIKLVVITLLLEVACAIKRITLMSNS